MNNPQWLEEIDGEEYERTGLALRRETTERGFGLIKFVDRYDKECSIQESSLATEAAIWLGTTTDRMHLTLEQVRVLLPVLQHFVENEELPTV